MRARSILRGVLRSITAGAALLAFLAAPRPASALAYSTWAAVYAGGGAEEMEGIRQTTDGGYIITGSTDSWGDVANGDAWVVKLDPYGNIDWQKTYGGANDETLLDVRQTSDGGYITVGWTKSFGVAKTDVWVVKLTANGAIEWQYSYGGSGQEQAWSVDLTSDGAYLVAGGTTSFGAGRSDYWVLKLDTSGTPIWQKTYGGSKNDGGAGSYPEYVVRAFEDAGGRYVVASESYSFGSGVSDIWVLQLDSSGNILWQAAYGGIDEDSMWTFAESAGGGYIVPGSTVSFSPDYSGDMWVLQLDTAGTIQWQKVFGVPGQWDEVLTVAPTSDGGSLIGGYVEQGQQDWDLLLLRLDSAGNALWKKFYEYGWDWPNAMQETANGGLVVAGVAWPVPADLDLWVLSLDANGDIGNSCSLINNLSLSEAVTNATAVSSNAVAQNSNATPQATNASVADSSVTANFLCQGQLVEDCANGVDDDGDNLIDCNDPDCTGDADADTFIAAPCGLDCNDNDPAINPSVAESCSNGVDDDCDGAADCNDVDCQLNIDNDLDGYFALPCGNDCDDSNAAVNPGAVEICSNTIDDECDGATDCDDLDCAELALCTLPASYARGSSSVKFNLKRSTRDRATLKTCVTQSFCSALAGIAGDAGQTLSATVGSCPAVAIGGDTVASKRSGSLFKAKAASGPDPAYSLKVDCRKLKSMLKLHDIDLAACATNPLATTLSAPAVRQLQASEQFNATLDGSGQTKRLRFTSWASCTP